MSCSLLALASPLTDSGYIPKSMNTLAPSFPAGRTFSLKPSLLSEVQVGGLSQSGLVLEGIGLDPWAKKMCSVLPVRPESRSSARHNSPLQIMLRNTLSSIVPLSHAFAFPRTLWLCHPQESSARL